ncbi:hypothetical protein BX616_000645 [Lobosporangium transversale]|nr:hypothetical protein BX616_000645 [Lobosporangium transversale]
MGGHEFVRAFEETPPKSMILKQVLTRLTTTRELWSGDEENEASFLKNMLAPCLDAYFGTMPNEHNSG